MCLVELSEILCILNNEMSLVGLHVKEHRREFQLIRKKILQVLSVRSISPIVLGIINLQIFRESSEQRERKTTCFHPLSFVKPIAIVHAPDLDP